MAKLRRELPATLSHCWPHRARYELQKDPTVLHKPRKWDRKVPSYPGHGGLSSGEVTPMAVMAKVAKAPLPRLKRLGEEVEDVEANMVELR